jgi:hypothetical protein
LKSATGNFGDRPACSELPLPIDECTGLVIYAKHSFLLVSQTVKWKPVQTPNGFNPVFLLEIF